MSQSIDRRVVLIALTTLSAMPAQANSARLKVYRSPTCGCCMGWVRHMERDGFSVDVINQTDLAPIKRSAGVPESLESCHTAFIDGYVVEGHVPAKSVRKLLSERPDIIGIAVAEMPTGSPGMEVPGARLEPFKVMTIPKNGAPSVFVDFPNGYRT